MKNSLNPLNKVIYPVRFDTEIQSSFSKSESKQLKSFTTNQKLPFLPSSTGKLIIGSPADRCGELKVGDRIIAVNRIDIAGMTHGDVVNLIKESGLHVRLTIGCPKEVGQPSPNQLNQQQQQQPHQLLTTKSSETQQYYGPLHQQPLSQPQQIHPQL